MAVDNAYTTAEDTPLVVAAPGVLGNDTDPDGDSLTVTGNTDPTNGTVTVNPNGSLTYTPDPNYNGLDSFTYDISDGNGGTDTATITITVNPVQDPPVRSRQRLHHRRRHPPRGSRTRRAGQRHRPRR